MKKVKNDVMFFDESSNIYMVLNKFLNYYFIQRDSDSTLSLFSDNVFIIGTKKDDVLIGKEAFKKLLLEKIKKIPETILYKIIEFSQKEKFDNCWECFCKLEINIKTPNKMQILYNIRLTISIHYEDGKYLIDTIHASEASKHEESEEHFPLKFISSEIKSVNKQTKEELFEIISQVMPGGIIGGYMEEGFPIYIANERLISMAGYDSYKDFYDSMQGLIINSIHENDKIYVNSLLNVLTKIGDQYELQYRMKKKSGDYFWVHGIGRRTVGENGRDAIISVIIDISEQVNRNKMLKKEAITDPLTGIYNRKGGINVIKSHIKECMSYMFFIVDIDNFKKVNDIYGHKQGDDVLCFLSKQMSKFFRKSVDVVCRLGGDEFVIFISNCDDIQIIENKINTIIKAYSDMIQLKYPLSKSTLSVGGVYTTKKYSFADIYQMTDKVLYKVKNHQKGKLNICFI